MFSLLFPQGEKEKKRRVLGELRLKLETLGALVFSWFALNPWMWNLAVSIKDQKVWG